MEEWQEALSTEWVMDSSSAGQSGVWVSAACLAFPPALLESLLNFYWMWNVKRGGGGGPALSHSPLFLLPSPSCLSLSVHARACHATGAQPQTVNADKINFLMFIPVGHRTRRRKKKKRLSGPAWNWECLCSTLARNSISRPLSLDWILNACLDDVAEGA